MGQGESNARGSGGADTENAGVADYYALLEVAESATSDEIKVRCISRRLLDQLTIMLVLAEII